MAFDKTKILNTLKEPYNTILHSLISRTENEVVEFKRAENSFDFDDLGKYFSALSNEANLRGLEFAWLIFGYDEKKRAVVGTSFKDGEGALNKLKHGGNRTSPAETRSD